MMPGIAVSSIGTHLADARDADWDSVVLYITANGPDEGQTFRDAGPLNRTMSINGGSQTKTDSGATAFGQNLCYCDGANDWVECADVSAFNIGASDFTFDCHFMLAGAGEYALWSQWGASSNKQLVITVKTNQLKCYWTTNGTTNVTAAVVPALSQSVLYHLRISRSGSSLYFFVDGTQVGSTQTLSGTIYDSTDDLELGTNVSGAAFDYLGWWGLLRMTIGVARSTSNFTAPSAPYPRWG